MPCFRFALSICISAMLNRPGSTSEASTCPVINAGCVQTRVFHLLVARSVLHNHMLSDAGEVVEDVEVSSLYKLRDSRVERDVRVCQMRRSISAFCSLSFLRGPFFTNRHHDLDVRIGRILRLVEGAPLVWARFARANDPLAYVHGWREIFRRIFISGGP